MSERVRTKVEGRIAEVRLDAPEKHNVLDREGWHALAGAMHELSARADLACVVVRGSGGRAFSAGSDISAFPTQRDEPEDVRTYSEAISRAMNAVRDCPHPTLAIIEGLCVGGGLEIAACCDLRICESSSLFGAPINRLGLTMSHAELQPLVALLGPGTVLDILLTGDLMDADNAARAGLVSRVVPDGEVVAAGFDLARRIAAGAPLVNRWHKQFIRRLADPRPMSDAEKDEALEAFGTADYREGRTAFLEKRDPDFRGE
jgi:enoyl-CoA hydratase